MSDSIDKELDRIAYLVDPEGYEKRKLEQEAGPWLEFAQRSVLELINPSAVFTARAHVSGPDKRTIVIEYSADQEAVPVVCIQLKVSGGQLLIWYSAVPGSPLKPKGNTHSTAAVAAADEGWIGGVVREILEGLHR